MNKCIVFGSPSNEYDVSKNTMNTIYNWCKKQGLEIAICEWTKTGKFVFSRGMVTYTFTNENDFCKYLSKFNYYVINALHGKYGEDGYIQKFFDDYKITYSGPESRAASITFDKHKTTNLIAKSDIQVFLPKEIIIKKGSSEIEINKQIFDSQLNFPLIAKPNSDGSSIGLKKLYDRTELAALLSQIEIKYLLQEFLVGREFSIGVIQEPRRDYWDLPITEIIPRNELFDYESKYTENGTKEITPGNLDIENTDKLKTFSKQIHSLFKLGLYSRSDFIITENKIYFLEVNSLPGLTINSILPKQLSHVGKYDDFMRILLSI